MSVQDLEITMKTKILNPTIGNLMVCLLAGGAIVGCGGGNSQESGGSSTKLLAIDTSATGFASIVTQAQFRAMFPNHNSFYTYASLVTAADSFVNFASVGSNQVKQQEAAAFLANVSHE